MNIQVRKNIKTKQQRFNLFNTNYYYKQICLPLYPTKYQQFHSIFLISYCLIWVEYLLKAFIVAMCSEEKDDAPAGWILCESKSIPGKNYYFHKKTGRSSWTRPDVKVKILSEYCGLFFLRVYIDFRIFNVIFLLSNYSHDRKLNLHLSIRK